MVKSKRKRGAPEESCPGKKEANARKINYGSDPRLAAGDLVCTFQFISHAQLLEEGGMWFEY